jgi:hypothetical protein
MFIQLQFDEVSESLQVHVHAWVEIAGRNDVAVCHQSMSMQLCNAGLVMLWQRSPLLCTVYLG